MRTSKKIRQQLRVVKDVKFSCLEFLNNLPGDPERLFDPEFY